MAVLNIVYEDDSKLTAELLESGADDNGWTLAADARIKTAQDSCGIGPVVYEGKPKDADGKVSKDGSPREGLFIFYKTDSVVRGTLEMVNPVDLQDTIADYLNARGGNVANMLTYAPTV